MTNKSLYWPIAFVLKYTFVNLSLGVNIFIGLALGQVDVLEIVSLTTSKTSERLSKGNPKEEVNTTRSEYRAFKIGIHFIIELFSGILIIIELYSV